MKGAPLSGVKVVDMSTTFAGPYAAMFLSLWGADVIKIEAPGGDVARYIGDVQQTGMGPAFLSINRGKRSIVLDAKTEGGRAVLDRLIAGSDAFLHNLRPSAAARLGLDPEEYLRRHPHLVFAHVRGYGSDGPDANRPAYDDVIQAGSGMAAVQGIDHPAYLRSSAADKTVGVYGAAAILAALVQQRATGVGAYVEIPMFETMAGFTLVEQQGGRAFSPPQGPTGYPRTASPYRRPFQTKDGFLAVMTYTDAQWRALFTLAGVPERADDPRYGSIRERTIHIDELYTWVGETMLGRTTDEWVEALDAAGIPCGRVNTLEDLYDDPQLAASHFFDETVHPTEGALRLPTTGVRFDRETYTAPPATLLGADVAEVLSEAGYSEQEQRALIESGAVLEGSRLRAEASSHVQAAEGDERA